MVTSKVSDMSNMFNNCTSLKYLKINFNTENVQRMQNMFSSCTKLTSLDISSFNTIRCTDFTNMFDKDEGLNLYINNQTCENLIDKIPLYVNVHNISQV